jgi:hypothetical protein
MSAAFDLLRPELLQSKMAAPETVICFVNNFLHDRRAFVSLNGEDSKIFKIPVGVSQGSVLGPKLFSLYTKGLSEAIQKPGMVNLVMYADDSYVICEADTEEELRTLVEETLAAYIDWLRSHGMVVNSDKTELMRMNNAKFSVDVDGVNLKSQPQLKVLGIVFDHRLNWERQVQKCISGCQSMKPALRRLKTKLHHKEFKQVISSHYFSRLYYASEMWFQCCSSKLKKRISTVHYYALRLLVNDYKCKLSRPTIDSKTERASPSELKDFRLAKTLISIVNNVMPFTLYQELLSHLVIERRNEKRPRFIDHSRLKIGRQSFPNRVSLISRRISFNWFDVPLSVDVIRNQIKSCFFTYKL